MISLITMVSRVGSILALVALGPVAAFAWTVLCHRSAGVCCVSSRSDASVASSNGGLMNAGSSFAMVETCEPS